MTYTLACLIVSVALCHGQTTSPDFTGPSSPNPVPPFPTFRTTELQPQPVGGAPSFPNQPHPLNPTFHSPGTPTQFHPSSSFGSDTGFLSGSAQSSGLPSGSQVSGSPHPSGSAGWLHPDPFFAPTDPPESPAGFQPRPIGSGRPSAVQPTFSSPSIGEPFSLRETGREPIENCLPLCSSEDLLECSSNHDCEVGRVCCFDLCFKKAICRRVNANSPLASASPERPLGGSFRSAFLTPTSGNAERPLSVVKRSENSAFLTTNPGDNNSSSQFGSGILPHPSHFISHDDSSLEDSREDDLVISHPGRVRIQPFSLSLSTEQSKKTDEPVTSHVGLTRRRRSPQRESVEKPITGDLGSTAFEGGKPGPVLQSFPGATGVWHSNEPVATHGTETKPNHPANFFLQSDETDDPNSQAWEDITQVHIRSKKSPQLFFGNGDSFQGFQQEGATSGSQFLSGYQPEEDQDSLEDIPENPYVNPSYFENSFAQEAFHPETGGKTYPAFSFRSNNEPIPHIRDNDDDDDTSREQISPLTQSSKSESLIKDSFTPSRTRRSQSDDGTRVDTTSLRGSVRDETPKFDSSSGNENQSSTAETSSTTASPSATSARGATFDILTNRNSTSESSSVSPTTTTRRSLIAEWFASRRRNNQDTDEDDDDTHSEEDKSESDTHSLADDTKVKTNSTRSEETATLSFFNRHQRSTQSSSTTVESTTQSLRPLFSSSGTLFKEPQGGSQPPLSETSSSSSNSSNTHTTFLVFTRRNNTTHGEATPVGHGSPIASNSFATGVSSSSNHFSPQGETLLGTSGSQTNHGQPPLNSPQDNADFFTTF